MLTCANLAVNPGNMTAMVQIFSQQIISRFVEEGICRKGDNGLGDNPGDSCGVL